MERIIVLVVPPVVFPVLVLFEVFALALGGGVAPDEHFDAVNELRSEEDQEIAKREQERNFARHRGKQPHDEQQDRIRRSDPFELDRDEEKQEDLEIRVEHRKCEKQRHIEVIVRCVPGDTAGNDVENDACEIEHIELERPPLAFEPCADHPVEIEGKHDEDRAVRRRQEHKRDDTPDLAGEDAFEVEIEQGTEVIFVAWVDEQVSSKHDRHAENDDVHQVRYRKLAAFSLQFVEPLQCIHGHTSGGVLGVQC